MMESLKEASKWRSAFKEVAALVGFSAGTSRDPDIQTVVETVQRMKTQGQNMQVCCIETGHMHRQSRQRTRQGRDHKQRQAFERVRMLVTLRASPRSIPAPPRHSEAPWRRRAHEAAKQGVDSLKGSGKRAARWRAA